MDPGTAADTSILLAVPMNQNEFRDRIDGSDWLGKFRPPDADAETSQSALAERWREVYLPLVAEPLQEVADLAHSAGAEVRTKAVISDLSAATATKRLVIVFAHWKGPEIVFDDLRPGWDTDSFLDRAARSETPLGLWIASKLQKRASTSDSGRLLDVLNASLDADLPASREVREHRVSRHARRREELEALLPGWLRAGIRLEMFDGLHQKEQVEGAISSEFSGILDLTACTSTVLADYLSGRRRFRFRTVQFPAVVEFIWAAKAVAGAFQLTGSGGMGYLEARNVAGNILTRAIKEHGKRD